MQRAIERARAWFAANGHGEIARGGTAHGQCGPLELRDGTRWFLKADPAAPPDQFAAEADGLAAIARSGAVRTPRVLHHERDYLLIEYIEPSRPDAAYWLRLGRGLAALHATRTPAFGFSRDNYCGATPQPNPRLEDGHAFFAEHRLRQQARRAHAQGLLTVVDLSAVERLCARLPELVPHMPAVLVHGDLWSGNVLCTAASEPVLIDPAAYWGWAEADIAMTLLFGGFAEEFYDAYLEQHPLQNGWRERTGIYNLYHLLNHLNLFGSAYLARARDTLARYW